MFELLTNMGTLRPASPYARKAVPMGVPVAHTITACGCAALIRAICAPCRFGDVDIFRSATIVRSLFSGSAIHFETHASASWPVASVLVKRAIDANRARENSAARRRSRRSRPRSPRTCRIFSSGVCRARDNSRGAVCDQGFDGATRCGDGRAKDHGRHRAEGIGELDRNLGCRLIVRSTRSESVAL